MAAEALTIALQALPHDADNLSTACAGAAAGAPVLPVLRHHGTFVPIDMPLGPGRSPWEGATRDPEKLRRLFAEHPHAVPAFVERMDFGRRARIWSDGRLTTIPTTYAKG